MPTMTVLSSDQKRKIFEALQQIASETILPALIAAALNNEIFPVEDKTFSDLCCAYAGMKIPEVKLPLAQAISALVEKKIAGEFQAALSAAFDADKWQSNFLIFLANTLHIEMQNQPLVQLAFEKGKVHWRILNGEQVLLDRTVRKNQSNPFDFSHAATVSMTWEQFRVFKDSGKRGGSVSITKTVFVNEFSEQNQNFAGHIWDELKQSNLLDHNNRLSHSWQFASAKHIYLNILGKQSLWYPEVSDKLHQINEKSENCELIDCIPEAKIHRHDRSPKKWAKTGWFINYMPKNDLNSVQLWDVSIYKDLNSHAIAYDGLDHDHIPSTSSLKSLQKSYVAAASACMPNQTMRSSISSEESALPLVTEDKEQWSCIAVPEALHKQGLSHGESSIMQQAQIKSPFLDELKDYLDKLELKWPQSSTPDDEYIKALGAFRYMYRSQARGKHGLTPQRFFNENSNIHAEIDALLYERLNKFMVKKEGDVNVSYTAGS